MPVRGRGSINLPFVRINWTRHGVFGIPKISSVSTHFWKWSWNSRTRRHRVDLPGPHHWWQSSKRRGEAASNAKQKRGK